MSALSWLWASGLVVLLLAILAALQLRKRSDQSAALLATPSVDASPQVWPVATPDNLEPSRPSALGFGTDPGKPAVTIKPLTDEECFRAAKPLELGAGLAGRVGALMQAAPSVLVENAHHGRHLMEVTINGELVRAASGEGFRAFAVDATRRISEHATLFDVGNLTKLVDAAAVWQVASVVVAQKHLADISAKLAVIAEGVSQLSTFLDAARRSRISATYGYLRQVAQALQAGELPASIRDELEACERDLLACQHHLTAEYRQRAQAPAKHTDTVGTGELLKSATEKFVSLERLAQDMALCLKARALAWYVLSLYPGEPKLKLARRDDILAGVAELRTLHSSLDDGLESDLIRFKAVFNFQKTLDERKQTVATVAAAARSKLLSGTQACEDGVSQTDTLLLQRDRPTHLIFEVQDGKVLQIRSVVSADERLTGQP